MSAAKSAKDPKDTKDSKTKAVPKWLVHAGVRHSFETERLIVQDPEKGSTTEIMSFYPAVYQLSAGNQITPVLRLPFLHTGFGVGRPEFKKDGVAKKGAERLTFNLAGKPLDPFGATNPVNEFHSMLGDLDAWTKDIARENKILGDAADTHAYDKCYVPLRREPGGTFPDQLTAKLPAVYGHPQWNLWDLSSKKPLNREEVGYDTLLSADITLPSIWVNYGSDTKGAQYGWTVECWNVYKPPKSYDEGYVSRKEAPAVMPW